VTEQPPTHCRRGHELGPGRILLGSDREGAELVRIYHCQVCIAKNEDEPLRYRFGPKRMDGPW